MIAATVMSMMTALAAPTATSFRVNVIWYMKVAGSAVAEPGPALRSIAQGHAVSCWRA